MEENYFDRHPDEREGIFTLPSPPPVVPEASDDQPEDSGGLGLLSWLARFTGRHQARD